MRPKVFDLLTSFQNRGALNFKTFYFYFQIKKTLLLKETNLFFLLSDLFSVGFQKLSEIFGEKFRFSSDDECISSAAKRRKRETECSTENKEKLRRRFYNKVFKSEILEKVFKSEILEKIFVTVYQKL